MMTGGMLPLTFKATFLIMLCCPMYDDVTRPRRDSGAERRRSEAERLEG